MTQNERDSFVGEGGVPSNKAGRGAYRTYHPLFSTPQPIQDLRGRYGI